MGQKVRAFIGVGCALLLVVLGVAWVWSYCRVTEAAAWKMSQTYGVVSERGKFSVVWLYSLARDEVEYPPRWGGAVGGEKWTPDTWGSMMWSLPAGGWPRQLWLSKTQEAATSLAWFCESPLEVGGAGVYVGDLHTLGRAGSEYVFPAMVVQVPYWMLLLVAGYGAVRGLWPWRPRWRVKTGSCLGCGYDLRASKERCPECGRAIPATGGENAGLSSQGRGIEKARSVRGVRSWSGRLLRRQRMLTRWVRRNVWWVLLTVVLMAVIVMQQRELRRPVSTTRVMLQPQVLRPVFLGQPVTAECKEAKLNELLARWGTEAKCHLRINWKALESAGVDPIMPVTLTTSGKVTLEEALLMLCQAVGNEAVDYDFDGEEAVVTSKEDLRKISQVTMVYHVADLLVPTNVQDGELYERADHVVHLVMTKVDPDSWREQGGTVGTIYRLGDRLVIRATWKTHRNLAAFFEQLRRGQGDFQVMQRH